MTYGYVLHFTDQLAATMLFPLAFALETRLFCLSTDVGGGTNLSRRYLPRLPTLILLDNGRSHFRM